jgi:thiamine phosphate synthase YjbQ (UPF0047 family)
LSVRTRGRGLVDITDEVRRWLQAIYPFEHRRRPHERRIAPHVLGD